MQAFASVVATDCILRFVESEAHDQPCAYPDDFRPMAKRALPHNRRRRVELYGTAYKLALEQIPPDQKRAQPDISLRIHASVRRQLKAGVVDAHRIAFAAVEDVLVSDSGGATKAETN